MLRTRVAALAAAVLIAGTVLAAAGPAFADPTTTSTSLPTCTTAASVPLYTAKCAPGVTGTVPGSILVTLPGVGTLTFVVGKDGTIDTSSTMPSATATGANFSAGTPRISADGTRITVTFVNIAKPAQHYTISVKISPPTSGGVPTINATAGPSGKGKGRHHHGDDDNPGKAEQHQGAKDPDDDGGNGANNQGANNQGQQAPLGQWTIPGGAPGGHGGHGGD